jgi:hypothetical protein
MSGLSVTATLTKLGSLLSLLGAGRKILNTYCLVNVSPWVCEQMNAALTFPKIPTQGSRLCPKVIPPTLPAFLALSIKASFAFLEL